MTDPIGMNRHCDAAVRTLIAMPTSTPSGGCLPTRPPTYSPASPRCSTPSVVGCRHPAPAPRALGAGFYVPDWLPLFVNAGRAFVTIGAVELFWVATAWPNGALAIVFTAMMVLLFSPKAEQAFAGAMAFTVGTTIVIPCAAIIKFAVLPGHETFPAFCLALGLYLIPIGFGVAYTRQPALSAVWTAMAFNFIPLLAPTNQMSFDTAQFYNSALSIFVGCGLAMLSFRLLPPLSPALRTERLLALTLRDLRHLAIDRVPSSAARLAGPHLRPTRSNAGPGQAVATRAAFGSAIGRYRNYRPSSHCASPRLGTGSLLGARRL